MAYYKAYDAGLKCLNKQYEENTVYEEDGNEICTNGVMHFCQSPVDTLNFYSIINCITKERSEFTTVEPLGEIYQTSCKSASPKIKVGERIPFEDYIKVCTDYIANHATHENEIRRESELPIFYSTDSNAMLDIYEYRSKATSAGIFSSVGITSDCSDIATAGTRTKIFNTGSYNVIASAGPEAQIASLGNGAWIASTGPNTNIITEGLYSHVACAGYDTTVDATNHAVVAITGGTSRIALRDQDSVGAILGPCGSISGEIGSWIVLAEWGLKSDASPGLSDGAYVKDIKAAQIDGVNLKPGVPYRLKDGKFVPYTGESEEDGEINLRTVQF